jgi:hypothetical protein
MFGYLFLSNRCEICNNMFKILQNEGIVNQFKIISVDTMPPEQLMNLNIEEVPTLIIRGQNNSSQLLETNNAFQWLQALITNRRQNMMNMVELNRRKLLQSNMQNKELSGPTGFKSLEMTGSSDLFSFVTPELENQYLPKSFAQVGGEERILAFVDDGQKMSEQDSKQRISQYDSFRKKQDGQISMILEKSLIDKVCNASMMN